jgi:chromosome segregation ATPase
MKKNSTKKSPIIKENDIFEFLDTVENLWHQNADAYDRCNNYETMIVKLKGERQSATQTLAEREKKIADLIADVVHHKKQSERAMEHINEQNKLISNAIPIIEELRNENKTLKNQKVNADHLAIKVREFLEIAERTTERMTKHSETLNKQIDILSESLAIKKTALDQTVENLIASKKEIDTLKTQSKKQRDILTDEIKNLMDFITKQSNQIDKYRVIIDSQKFALIGIANDDGFFNSKKKSKRASETIQKIDGYKKQHGLL